MAPKKCEYGDCTWTCDTENLETYLGLYKLHIEALHKTAQGSTKVEKAKRPELASEVSDEDWAYFISRWKEYKKATNLTSVAEILTQLMECCCEQLRRDHHRMFLSSPNDGAEASEDSRIRELKQIAVRKRNKAVNRVKLTSIKQDRGEPIRKFAGRVRSLAAVSDYSVKCAGCQAEVPYTDQVIMDQVINGLADTEIQRDVLSHADADTMTLDKLLLFVEGKESGLSSQGLLNSSSLHSNSEVKPAKCRWCGDSHIRGKINCKAPSHKCEKCGKMGHFEKVCRSSKPKPEQATAQPQPNQGSSVHSECSIFINKDFIYPGLSLIKNEAKEKSSNLKEKLVTLMVGSIISASSPVTPAELFDHHVHDSESGWVRRDPKEKPYSSLRIEFDNTSARSLNMRTTSRQTREFVWTGMCDTGASVTMAGRNTIRKLGLDESHVTPCSLNLNNADMSPIKILGVIPVNITDVKSNSQTKQILYITDGANGLLLSQEACIDLGFIDKEFPKVKSSQVCTNKTGKKSDCDCDCPERSPPPEVPSQIPFPPTPENVPRLQQWICEYYAASAFNCCECQPLPKMHGPPLKIFIQEGAKPVAAHTPIPIPLHWQKEVKAGLDRDEAIGVIERVPSGTPTTWCHRMVVVPKKDNTPRRTVNFQPLNRYSTRQTHHTMSPFHQASMVPSNTKKTVLDAWNGYHSVYLDPSCRDLTTFITPWGRYRYKTTPQGYLAAGDAYTERFDRIIADVKNKTKCVDDAILWSNSIQESFIQTCEFLTLCSKNGVVFNKKKFQFCQDEVEFAGFSIGKNTVKPSEKILESIKDFPVPKTISDVRGWFGLVNQVAPFFANRPVMEPFRELLKPSVKGKQIYWDDNLTKLFEESKVIITEAIKEGIKCYRVGDWTCLMPDFCKTGIGFLLMQKRCKCEKISPYCCPGGWQITLAGSRFTKGAETRYAPVEGEALAVAWSLEATRHYTLGNTKLLVATDHKPLLKVLGDRKLEEIDNPRLLKLKEKTLRWQFDIIHVPGKTHIGPDTLSRKEVTNCLVNIDCDETPWDETDMELSIESQVAAAVPAPISWQQIRDEISQDKTSGLLLDQICDGFPPDKKLLRTELREYFHHRDHLTQVDGVPLYKGRVIVPARLRQSVLETLHAAHQGVTGMTLRAQSSVWWPGITPQIKETRDKCRICHETTPSQPSAPPQPLPQPDFPFQQIAADYFQAGGYHYLVVVDRYSGWPAVQYCGSSSSTSTKLREWLRQFFSTFGIPEELSTDGGLTFTAYETQQFLSDYGIRHRLSSVAFPHSNQRAELGVKSMKRLIRDNTSGDGSLDNDKFLRALLQYRNTPDRDTGFSPAQVIFGRNLRDFLPAPQSRYKPQPQWIMLQADREKALAKRAALNMERLSTGTKALPPLCVGDSVLVQNQTGNYPSRWDITGVVVEVKDHDQYVIKVDGSGRMTLRNRKFLRKITPYQNIKHFRTVPPPPSPDNSDHDQPAAQSSPPAQSEETDRPGPRELPAPPQSPEVDRPEVHGPPEEPPAPLQPSPDSSRSAPAETRRSGRTSKAPDRLVVTGVGKSYDTTNLSISPDFHRSLSGGGGSITECSTPADCTSARSQPVWRPWTCVE